MIFSETILPRCRAYKPAERSLTNKSRFPPRNEVLTTALLLTDGSIRLPVRELKDHLRTPHFSCLHRPRGRHFFQFLPLMGRKAQISLGTEEAFAKFR